MLFYTTTLITVKSNCNVTRDWRLQDASIEVPSELREHRGQSCTVSGRHTTSTVGLFEPEPDGEAHPWKMLKVLNMMTTAGHSMKPALSVVNQSFAAHLTSQ